MSERSIGPATSFMGKIDPLSRQGSFQVNVINKVTTDTSTIVKLMGALKTFLFNSHGYYESAIRSFNCVLNHVLNQDLVLAVLKAEKLDHKLISLYTVLLLMGTYSSQKLKQVLTQKVEESFQKGELQRHFLKTIHEFGLKAGYHQILNIDHIQRELGISNEIQHRSKQLAIMIPDYQERLSTFNIVSKYGLAFYSWNVYRMDDFDFSIKEYSISPKLKLNWFDEKSPQQNFVIPEEQTKEPEEDPMITKEIHLNDMIWVRPRTLSSKKGSTRQILRSSDEATVLNFSKAGRSESKNLDIDHKDVDIDNIDTLFDHQETIESLHPFDHSCYESLRLKEPSSPEQKQKVEETRFDDSYVLFHGLTHIGPSLYDRVNNEFSIKNFYSSPPVLVMKAYKSCYDEDIELINLVKSLGCPFNCLPEVLLGEEVSRFIKNASPSQSPLKKSNSELVLVQGVSSMTYAIINNNDKLLHALIEQSKVQLQSVKSSNSPLLVPTSGMLPALVLFGFDQEIEEFKTKNSDLLRQFEKIITLSKSFDVDVLQLQVTQICTKNNYKSSSTSKWPNERLLTRELVNVPFIENRLYTIITG